MEDPDRLIVTCGTEQLTRAQLESAANRLARDFQASGVRPDDLVTIALANSVDWFVAAAAAWKLGATAQPVSAMLPARELAAIVELARPTLIVGAEPGSFGEVPCLPVGYQPSPELDDGPLPDAVAKAWKAPTSGGSTGRPKLIVSGDPSLIDLDGPTPLLLQRDGCLVMPGPMYHNGPIVWACQALLWGNHVVVLPRFDAVATLAEIRRNCCLLGFNRTGATRASGARKTSASSGVR